jgi:DNA-binding transcriptional MerR regulator
MAIASGVSAHTLRYYERAGLIRPVARNPGNQRRYSQADVEWLKFLLRLRETGMPVAQMREYSELREQGIVTLASRLALLESHQSALNQQIFRLQEHQKALETKIATYRSDLAAQHVNTYDEGASTDE